VVPAADLLAHFASDRRHMVKQGCWQAPPPPEPCIRAADGSGCTHNLDRYLDMRLPAELEAAGDLQAVAAAGDSSRPPMGEVLTEAEFVERFRGR